MFGKKKQKYIKGFGNVRCNKKGLFETTLVLWDKTYEIELDIETDFQNDSFTEEQEIAFEDFMEKRREIQEYIEKYYSENYIQIIEDYYIAQEKNWRAMSKAQEEFDEIISSYKAENKNALRTLISFFEPQMVIFKKNGESALIGFVAVTDDHGIAITVKPRLEIMTQDEYYNAYDD